MAFKSFAVGPQKSLVRAELSEVPDVMVVVGPNGAGKSTLLYELQRRKDEFAEPGTHVVYLNPNRPWRRTNFGAAFLYNLNQTFRQMTEAAQFPGFTNYQPPGFVHSGLPRSPDNVDDVQSLVKFSIAKLEARRQRGLAEEFDRRGGELPRGAVADAFTPLRELVENLLPHLRFAGVDMSNENLLQVFFDKLDGTQPLRVEMDDLSSGEKAVIQLFLPFIEERVDRLLTGSVMPESARSVALIDEPELHLHPALQVALIAYLRQLAASGEAQFIIATHSTAIMDCVEDDELYLLVPPATVGAEENQLMRLTATAERLDAVRQIAGSTYVVTRCRPIVFIEGEVAAGSRGVTDQRLVEILLPEARGWVLVPSRSKAEAIKAADDLREPSLTHLPGMPVFALVDSDQDQTHAEYVITWPVAMIENLLLDPAAIWAVIAPMKEQAGLGSEYDIRDVLERYSVERRDREISLRVRRRLPRLRIVREIVEVEGLKRLPREVRAEVEAFTAQLDGGKVIASALDEATSEVDKIIADATALQRFHGKELLRRFFDEHAKHCGLSYQAFCYGVAVCAKDGDRLHALLELPVRRVRQFVPSELLAAAAEALESLPDEARSIFRNTVRALEASRKKWEAGVEDETDRAALRQELSSLARHVKQAGHAVAQQRLLSACVSLGPG